jgi:chromosome segregation ATPase
VFVILLVVLSLLLCAGVVTFVNTSNFSKTVADANQRSLTEAKADNARLSSTLSTMNASQTVALSEKDSVIKSLQDQLTASQQHVAQLDSDKAELTANLALATTAQTTANDALKAMQTAYAERNKNYDDLRVAYDKQQKQLVDDNLRIDDLTNTVDVSRHQSKYMGEQVAQLQENLSRANAVLKQNGLTVSNGAQNASASINADSGVAVNARVEETRTIGGVRYATINVGSADQVARNMQLKVVDPRSHQFLGYIVVDTVYPHQAIGRLEGPRVGDIQPQVSEVRSQL